MRSRRRVGFVLGLGVVLLLGVAVPAAGLAASAGSVVAGITGVACNPSGSAGLRVTAAASAPGGALSSAQLYAGEFRAIGEPFFPFSMTGSTVSNWNSFDSFTTKPSADSRTLDTTDPYSWNRHNYAPEVWATSDPGAWWLVGYVVTSSVKGRTISTQVTWYVSCPTGTIRDAADLVPLTRVYETGLR